MASTHTYTHRSADPVLGIRVGCDACRRANGMGHSPRGAIMRLARDLAEYGAEQTRLADGTYRHARRTAVVKGDGSRVRPRITLENVLAAERWYASHERVPSQADLRTILGAAMAGTQDEQAILRDALTAAKRDASPEGERVRAAQDREQRRERERARRIAAKGSR
jgi:hypothetical protein